MFDVNQKTDRLPFRFHFRRFKQEGLAVSISLLTFQTAAGQGSLMLLCPTKLCIKKGRVVWSTACTCYNFTVMKQCCGCLPFCLESCCFGILIHDDTIIFGVSPFLVRQFSTDFRPLSDVSIFFVKCPTEFRPMYDAFPNYVRPLFDSIGTPLRRTTTSWATSPWWLTFLGQFKCLF